LFEKFFIFFVFEGVKLVQVLVFQPVFMGLPLRFTNSFFDYRSRRRRLFRNNAVFPKNVIPASSSVNQIDTTGK
jgi:hypothetical protein